MTTPGAASGRTDRVLLPIALIALTSTGMAGGAPLQTSVLYTPTENLTYQLDAVSGTLEHIDPADYQALWNQEFLKSDVDRKMIRRWGELKSRYAGSLRIPMPEMPLQAIDGYVSLSERLRIAGLRAMTDEEFLRSARLLMLPTDLTDLEEVVRHFSPRFRQWWQREAAPAGRSFVR